MGLKVISALLVQTPCAIDVQKAIDTGLKRKFPFCFVCALQDLALWVHPTLYQPRATVTAMPHNAAAVMAPKGEFPASIA